MRLTSLGSWCISLEMIGASNSRNTPPGVSAGNGRPTRKIGDNDMKETFCNWAICYDIAGKHYDDGQTRTVIAAILRYPMDAERFIATFLPVENRDRFYIKPLSRCEVEFA